MTPDVAEVMDLVDWAEERVLPVSGGVYDQTASFMETLRLVRSERARIELARHKRT